jgi:hypothetical protein
MTVALYAFVEAPFGGAFGKGERDIAGRAVADRFTGSA